MLLVKGILSCLIIITYMITVVWGVVISFKVNKCLGIILSLLLSAFTALQVIKFLGY